jgi:hypothetical protein
MQYLDINLPLISGFVLGAFFSFFLLILFLDKALNIFFEDFKIEIKKWLEDQKPEDRPEDDADWWKKS